MARYLTPDVHAAEVGEALVLLDVGRDDYLLLPDGASALVRDGAGDARYDLGRVGRELESAGLLGPVRRSVGTLPAKPVRTAIHDAPSRPPSAAEWWAAARAGLEMRAIAPGSGVAAYLTPASVTRDYDPSEVVRAARSFWTIAPWLPIEGECLTRSALLMRYLRHRGLSADWVFGVRLWPFMAHCWVQVGDVCLNDDIERLAAYTPIYRHDPR